MPSLLLLGTFLNHHIHHTLSPHYHPSPSRPNPHNPAKEKDYNSNFSILSTIASNSSRPSFLYLVTLAMFFCVSSV